MFEMDSRSLKGWGRGEKLDFIPFQGGYDEITPPYQMKPGKLRSSENFEVGIAGGYNRAVGYERFDGRTKPSSATYSIMSITISGSFSAGDSITGATSSATAEVLAVVTTTTPNYLALTKVVGTFVAENIQVSAVTQGVITLTPFSNAATTPLLNAAYNNLAADEYRSDIGAVTGSGNILGVVYYNDVAYAFRNNVGGTAANLYKSTTSGWTQVTLGEELTFTSGSTEPDEGDAIQGQTSSATATVARVVLTSGTFAGGDAAGKLILSGVSGTFNASELIDNTTDTATNVLTTTATNAAITLAPNGRYEFDIHNFGSQLGTRRIYGCDGVNRGFEFNGTVFVPIDTGMSVSVVGDKPSHVRVHKGHLFFSFGSSIQNSSLGFPYLWSAVFGASEIGLGDVVTSMITQPGSESGGALTITTRNTSFVLYGSTVSDFNLVKYREEIGGAAYTVQDMGMTVMLDDRGVTTLVAAQEFGNFTDATITSDIKNFINSKRNLAVASCIVREKNQYRLFFSDKSALYITFDNKRVTGIMPQSLTHSVTCCFSTEDSSGAEVILFGSGDGYVYQMEKGTSFDGENVNAFMVLHYIFSKSPQVMKNYKQCTLEVGGNGYAEFDFGYEINYGVLNTAQPSTTESNIVNFAVTRWDAFTWDSFYWDGKTLSPNRLRVKGSGENISLTIRTNSDSHESIKFTGAVLRYQQRRIKR